MILANSDVVFFEYIVFKRGRSLIYAKDCETCAALNVVSIIPGFMPFLMDVVGYGNNGCLQITWRHGMYLYDPCFKRRGLFCLAECCQRLNNRKRKCYITVNHKQLSYNYETNSIYLSLVLVVLALASCKKGQRTCLPSRPAVGLTKHWS